MPVYLSSRFIDAFTYALELHQNQMRKGTHTPYLSHLLAVCALVLEGGGDEDQAIAALLHDAVEDQGGMETLAQIQQRFGERVARIVDGCTDTYEQPKPDWKGRKERYLEHLKYAEPDVMLVSMADKLHNARTIVTDLRRFGPKTFERFNGRREGTLWYYRSLVESFSEYFPSSPLLPDFIRIVEVMNDLAYQPWGNDRTEG